MRLPAGYVDYDRGTVRVIATQLELEEMVGLLLDAQGRRRPVSPPAPGEVPAAGRGGARRIVLPGGKAVYVRNYRRGGIVRHFITDLFLKRPERPLRELVVTEAARAAGCPVPTVMAVCIEEAGLFYRGAIVTEEIDGAVPLIEEFEAADSDSRARLLARVGVAVRGLHDAGIYHVDLTGYNVLVDGAGSPVLIDFDRGFMAAAAQRRLAGRGLERFWRSMKKLCAARGVELLAAEHAALLEGYENSAPDGLLVTSAAGKIG